MFEGISYNVVFFKNFEQKLSHYVSRNTQELLSKIQAQFRIKAIKFKLKPNFNKQVKRGKMKKRIYSSFNENLKKSIFKKKVNPLYYLKCKFS